MDKEKNMKKVFYIVVILQIVFLLGMIAFKQSTVLFGTRVVLKTVPYDPTNIFRGDYVNIRYAISNIDLSSIRGASDFKTGDTVYVKLEKQKDYWDAVEVSRDKFDDAYLKGIIQSVNTKALLTIKDINSSKEYIYNTYDYGYYDEIKVGDKVEFYANGFTVNWANKCYNNICEQKKYSDNVQTGTVTKIEKGKKEFFIEYPIQSYFVPKNEGNLPQFNTGEMLVEVALWRGDAVATNLIINGQPIDFR